MKRENESLSCSVRFEVATIKLSLGINTGFAIRPQFPGSQKHVSLKFLSCVKTLLKHTVLPWEKRSRESVLWVLTAISVVTLIRWNCTVRWLPRKKWQVACFFFKKAQILDQRWCYEEKNEPRCFSQYWGYNFPALTGGKYCFCQWAPMPRFRKTWFSAVSELCKNTTRTHCTIPWEKRSRENVLWMLNPITVVTPNK